MRTILLCTLVLAGMLTLAGCDAVSSDDEVIGPDGDVLMPLAVGNTWTYQTDGGGTFRLTATGTVSRDGAVWTVVKDSQSDPQDTQGAYRNTEEGLQNAEYHPRNDDLDPPTLLLRFPVEEGAAYTFSGWEVRVERENVEVPAGTFAAYTYVTESEVEGTIRWSFTPGIGLVHLRNPEGTTFALSSYDLQ